MLCAVFILPKAVSKFYYDPNEAAGAYEGMTTTRMSLDLSVYSELYLPGNYRDQEMQFPEAMANTISLSRRLTHGRENLLPSAADWCEANLLCMITIF